jgi:hypothetical protein
MPYGRISLAKTASLPRRMHNDKKAASTFGSVKLGSQGKDIATE